MERPTQIQAHHLEKVALIYIRQSTEEQVRHNTGSTEFQRRLADRARQLGWPESRITTIDDDLGKSASRPGRRHGFRRMLDLMRRGEVAIVFLSDASRLSRHPLEAEEFLWVATRHSVLIEVSGKLFSPGDGDLAELFNLRFQSLFAWWDHANLRRRLDQGKRMKISLGNAVSRPPVGFIMPIRGKWVPDPTPEIRASIRRVFTLYLELGSANKVARYLRAHGLRLPRRARDGRVVWDQAGQLQLIRLLRDPNFTDAYVYFRTKTVPVGEGDRRQVRPRSEWQIVPNHHEGVITWDEWERVQTQLDRNRRTTRPPILHGAALLQGLLWCSRCERRVNVAYDRRIQGRHFPAYFCGRIENDKLVRFHRVPAERLDIVVAKVVVAALAAPAPDDLRAVLHAYQDDREGIRCVRDAGLKRAEADVADAKRRYQRVEAENDLVRPAMEAEYQAALRRHDQIKREHAGCSPEPAPELGDAELDELVALSRRIESLWDAAAATNEDRKRLLHAVLSRVEIREYTDEEVVLNIKWVGGLEETRRAIRSKGIDAAVAELRGAGYPDAQIADRLHAQGVIARGGGRVCRQVITKRVRRLGIQHEATWRAGLLRIRELMEQEWSSRRILQDLVANGPRHYHNKWNLKIVQDAMRKLRTGRGPLHGVPPLPSGPEHRRRTSEEALSLLLRLRAKGRPWAAVADELNAAGYRSARGRPFTDRRCAALFFKRRTRGTPTERERRPGQEGDQQPTGAATSDRDRNPDRATAQGRRHENLEN